MSEKVLKGQVTIEDALVAQVALPRFTVRRECARLSDLEYTLCKKLDATKKELSKFTAGRHISGDGAMLVRRLDALESAHASVVDALETLSKIL